MTDSTELVRRAAEGDAEALDGLIRAHEPSLLAFVRARAGAALRARESVRDILQEVLLELARGVHAVECRSEAEFRGWLYTLAERRIRDRARYHRRERRASDRELALDNEEAHEAMLAEGYSGLSSPSHRLQRMEEIRQLEAAFAQLGDDDREVLSLAFFCGLDSAGIARELGINEEAARKRKNRARVRLAALWGGTPGSD